MSMSVSRGQDSTRIFITARGNARSTRSRVDLWATGLGKNDAGQHHRRRAGCQSRQTSGPVLERPGDLAALLTNLQARDVLFVDEIHRLSPVVEEVLYPAMEDYQLDIMIGEGPAARSIKAEPPALHPGRRNKPEPVS